MLLASSAAIASIFCLCCLWCTRSSVTKQLARSRHSNTKVGIQVMYTLDVHCISLVATDARYAICGGNWAASLPSSLLRLPPSISPRARPSSTSHNPLQDLDLKTVLASPEEDGLYKNHRDSDPWCDSLWTLYISKQLSSPIPRL